MSFVVNIQDDCEVETRPVPTTEGIFHTQVGGHVNIGVVSHYAIIGGHGVYYPSVADVPPQRAAFFDLASLSLIPVGDA